MQQLLLEGHLAPYPAGLDYLRDGDLPPVIRVVRSSSPNPQRKNHNYDYQDRLVIQGTENSEAIELTTIAPKMDIQRPFLDFGAFTKPLRPDLSPCLAAVDVSPVNRMFSLNCSNIVAPSKHEDTSIVAAESMIVGGNNPVTYSATPDSK